MNNTEEIVELKDLLKKMKKTKKAIELDIKSCKAIASYAEDLENKILDLEKEIKDSKKVVTVTPIRNDAGYFPVCPKCGRDLGDKQGSRYCECGAVLSWIRAL